MGGGEERIVVRFEERREGNGGLFPAKSGPKFSGVICSRSCTCFFALLHFDCLVCGTHERVYCRPTWFFLCSDALSLSVFFPLLSILYFFPVHTVSVSGFEIADCN